MNIALFCCQKNKFNDSKTTLKMQKLFFSLLIGITSFFLSVNGYAQADKQQVSITCVGFYNLENLFDTLVDPDSTKILQDEFTPKGKNRWTTVKYNEKLGNMARVISELGKDVTPDGVAILGVSEVENRLVLEDLVKQESIKDRNYQIVHYDSPDKRGIDVGLLYNPNYFKNVTSKSFTLKIPEDTAFFTRDQLLVSGELHGENIYIIVSHWPSRRGGEKKSKPKRIAAAQLARSIVDSLQNYNPDAKIFFMGDLNDDPVDISVKGYLKAEGKEELAIDGKLFNPFEDFFKKGIGTLGYNDAWNLFDQIIISPSLLGKDYTTLKFHKAVVFNKPYLKTSEGRFKGYPHRTFSFGEYIGGYSDHFPVYLFLVKNIN